MKIYTLIKPNQKRLSTGLPAKSLVVKVLGAWKITKHLILLVPELGIEPRRGRPRGILSPVRLPISPLRHL
jgi:hypothetical protein